MWKDTTEVGPWYEHTLPTTRAQYSSDGKLHGKCMTFAGARYDEWHMSGQYHDYGSICAGYGAKVMYKYYEDGNFSGWCSNRHIPIGFELAHYDHGKRVGKALCYNHSARKICASSLATGEINIHSFIPIEQQMGDGGFVTKVFHNRTQYEKAKTALLSETCIFIGNCAIPQDVVWGNFAKCWTAIITGKQFDWWECFMSQPQIIQLSYDFSLPNRRMLYELIDSQEHIWITANRIRIEGDVKVELRGTGPDFPWLT